MNIPLRRKIARLIVALLGVLVLTTSAALGAVPAQRPESAPGALVRIDIKAAGDLERFAALGLPVYAHLFSQSEPGKSEPGKSRREYLLLEADAGQQSALSSAGFSLKVLDADSSGASYYLLSTRDPGTLAQAAQSVAFLDWDGATALVRGTGEEIEPLAALGVEISALQLHRLVIREPRPAAWPEVLDPDPVIQGMVDQVSSSTVYNYDAGLSGEWAVIIGGQPYTITTRNSRTVVPIENATQYGYEHFSSLGLDTSFHYYNLSGSGARRNVIAEQLGMTQPDNIYLITAHLDSTAGNPWVPEAIAPGADDNASGSTGVLLAADILSQYDFDCTLRYALFTGEEQGLYGSYAYAQSAYNNGDNVLGVLNLDMIGYNSDHFPYIELHTRPGNVDDLAIANLFADAVSAYNLNLTPLILQDGITASDHASFWQFGYPAILAIEDWSDHTPYYHQTGDKVDTLDLAYFTDFVKASVATFAHMGCLSNSGTLEGQVRDAETSAPVSGANVTAEHASGQSLSTLSGLTGDYQLSLSAGTYTVTAQADGYEPFSAGGIDITMDLTTTLDIPLQPCNIQAPDFVYAPAEPMTGVGVVFTGTVGITSTTPVSYTWDFGDGHNGSGQVATHTYTVSDTYTVSMNAENCVGVVTATHPVAVTGAPGLSVSMDSLDVEVPYGDTQTQMLEIGSSGETPLSWNLTEQPEVPWLEAAPSSGTLDPQAREEITLTIQAPLAHGTDTTTLVVMSNDPGQPQKDIPVTLVVPCTGVSGVDFVFTPLEPRGGEVVTFTSQMTGSQPIQYNWSYMDGSPPVIGKGLASVEHTFPGDYKRHVYPVILAAQNACSEGRHQRTRLVLVSPFAAFLPIVPSGSP